MLKLRLAQEEHAAATRLNNLWSRQLAEFARVSHLMLNSCKFQRACLTGAILRLCISGLPETLHEDTFDMHVGISCDSRTLFKQKFNILQGSVVVDVYMRDYLAGHPISVQVRMAGLVKKDPELEDDLFDVDGPLSTTVQEFQLDIIDFLSPCSSDLPKPTYYIGPTQSKQVYTIVCKDLCQMRFQITAKPGSDEHTIVYAFRSILASMLQCDDEKVMQSSTKSVFSLPSLYADGKSIEVEMILQCCDCKLMPDKRPQVNCCISTSIICDSSNWPQVGDSMTRCIIRRMSLLQQNFERYPFIDLIIEDD